MGDTMGNNISEEIYEILSEAKKISTSNPNNSYVMSKEAYRLSKENNLNLEEGYALIGMSLACRSKSEINKMLSYAYNALEIFEASKEVLGQVKALNLIGIAYFYNAMYDEAYKNLFQALGLLEGSKDYYILSSILNNIGEIFRESGKYERALEYYNSALKMCTKIDSRTNKASLLGNIGEVYFLETKYEEALKYFTESFELIIEEKDMVMLGEIENKLGKIYFIYENYSKAADYFFSALIRLDKVDNKFYAIDVLVNIANLELKRDSSKFIYYFEKAIRYAEKTKAKKKLSEVCKIVAVYYEKIENYKDALIYFKKHQRVDQEIMTSVLGNKLEILKIELAHLRENQKYEKTQIINQKLEMEISKQKNELEKIQEINEVLEKNALEDELTRVPNRRYINYHLNKVWEESLINDKTITLFIIDVDNFKKYNDFWGHLKGDECLIKIADCLKNIQQTRNDIFGRYGGEEFIYFAEDLDYDESAVLGNLIRTEVENIRLKYTLAEDSKVVTLSVGGALGKASDFINVSNMIQIADEGLYKAKNMGRNITFI